MAGLTLAAWLALWSWSASPYGRYLDHGSWTDVAALAALCRAVPEGDIVIPALLYAAGWVLMIAAMMLPTTFPILGLFRRMTAHRPDGRALVLRVVAGYLIAWLGFGLAAHGLDWGVHAVGARVPWLAQHGWVVGAATVLGAGSLGWMLALAAVMAAEKNLPGGKRLRTPLGVALIAWAAGIVAVNLT